jgi:hypothetical protein
VAAIFLREGDLATPDSWVVLKISILAANKDKTEKPHPSS